MYAKTLISRAAIIFFLIFIAGMAKGASDTLQFHYGRSVFATFQNEQWWNPAESWKNKYKDYDAGDKREAYLGSRSLLVWLTDAWHLAQTIETLAWALATMFAIRLGFNSYNSESRQRSIAGLIGFLVLTVLVFYTGFLFLYGWVLVR